MAKAKYSYNEKRKEWSTLVYDGTLTDTGAKHRKWISSKKSSADLEKKVNEFKRSLEEGTKEYKLTNITFGEYAQEWLETSKSSREQNTKRMYDIVLRSCFNSINDIPLAKITHSHFQKCINNKQEHPRTCQQIYVTFKQIIKSAVREGYLPHTAIENVLVDISLPKYQKPLKRPLSGLEKTAIQNADLDDRKRAFVSILYYCGLRKSEALALTASDFDFNNKTVSISKAWVDGSIKPYPKSDNGIRVIPLPDASIPKIKPFVESEAGFIFHGKDKEIMTGNAYRRMWDSIICSLNIAAGYNPNSKKERSEKPIKGLTAHIFRHNYCTELCYQIPQISTKMIAKLLGDTEKMVIDVYSHLVEEKENTSDALNSIFDA
jgi:integrase